MVFSPETMEEIVEIYLREKFGLPDAKVEGFYQKKHHNVRMFEAKVIKDVNERNSADEA